MTSFGLVFAFALDSLEATTVVSGSRKSRWNSSRHSLLHLSTQTIHASRYVHKVFIYYMFIYVVNFIYIQSIVKRCYFHARSSQVRHRRRSPSCSPCAISEMSLSNGLHRNKSIASRPSHALGLFFHGF